MNLSTMHGFAFICVPKTGSTSIDRALAEHSSISYSWKPSLKHMPAKVLNSHVLPFHSKLFPDVEIEISCVIRNPADWVASWYRYRCREELLGSKRHRKEMYVGEMTFEEFVNAVVESEPNSGGATDIGTQQKYITDPVGILAVDKLFRFEDGLNKVEEYFSAKTGSKIKFPILNKSPHKEISISTDLLGKIEQAFAIDYEIYESFSAK